MYRNDFYLSVNKEWLNSFKIPDDEKRWSNFNILVEKNKEKVKDLVINSINSNDINFNKVGILYHQGMDLDKRNMVNNDINYFFNKINIANNNSELIDLIYKDFISNQLESPISLYAYSDFANSNFNILHISADGLGLPDRDYYFLEDKKKIREEYKKFISSYSKLYNLNLDSDLIFNFEKSLAGYHYTKTEARDPERRNNPIDYKTFLTKYPNLELNKFFEYIKFDVMDESKINISNPKYLEYLNKVFGDTDIKILKSYLKWMFILSIGSFLDIEKEKALFNFYENFLSGTPKMKDLWKRCLSLVSQQLGKLVGKMYVDKYFTQDKKKSVESMVYFIKEELRNRLLNNDWMENSTKQKAILKLDRMKVKIGYPEKWKDYNLLEINSKSSYFVNNLRCNNFEFMYNMSELYQPKDLSKWFMAPHMVNAYYSPSFNEIVFPAGILQSPFYDQDRDISENFGAIGCVIGHEMTHGFDDQGKKYDSCGNLNIWWTDNDSRKYEAKSKNLINQFQNYEIEGERVNGKLTLGENIADLGGVSISLKALERYFKENNLKDKNILNHKKKLFFESYARMWRCKTRKEEILKRIISDPHSPPIFRVNGILGNIDDFYKIYKIKKNHSLWIDEDKRTSIW